MDIEQRLRTALREGAQNIELPSAGPEAARQRARQRLRRRQAATGGLTAVVVAVVGITGWQLMPDRGVRLDGDLGVVAANGNQAAGGSAAVLDELAWRDADGTIGPASRILYSPKAGTYYALSTAPGATFEEHPDGAIPQALYRSSDGLSWDVAELGEEPWIADLGERDGVLYAVSTAPATSGTGIGRAGVSTDGGRTWSQVDLPSTATAPDATVPLEGPTLSAAISAGDDVLIAHTSTTYRIDPDALFSGDELGDDRYVQSTAEGMALVEASCDQGEAVVPSPEKAGDDAIPDGPVPAPEPTEADEAGVDFAPSAAAGGRPVSALPADPCPPEEDEVVRVVPWSELGLDGPEDLRIQELFRSTDGETWEVVDAGDLAGHHVEEIAAGPNGFMAITWPTDEGGPQLLRSVDGEDWEPLTAPGPATGLGFVGDRIVGTTARNDGSLEAFSSDDGGATWTTADLTRMVDPEERWQYSGVYAQATGPLGSAVIVGTHTDWEKDAELHLLTSADGVTWAVTPLSEVVGGETPSAVSWIAVGRDSIALSAVWHHDGEPSTTRTFVGTPGR